VKRTITDADHRWPSFIRKYRSSARSPGAGAKKSWPGPACWWPICDCFRGDIYEMGHHEPARHDCRQLAGAGLPRGLPQAESARCATRRATPARDPLPCRAALPRNSRPNLPPNARRSVARLRCAGKRQPGSVGILCGSCRAGWMAASVGTQSKRDRQQRCMADARGSHSDYCEGSTVSSAPGAEGRQGGGDAACLWACEGSSGSRHLQPRQHLHAAGTVGAQHQAFA
jgi:hypothetical protein